MLNYILSYIYSRFPRGPCEYFPPVMVFFKKISSVAQLFKLRMLLQFRRFHFSSLGWQQYSKAHVKCISDLQFSPACCPFRPLLFWRFTEKSEAANDPVVLLGCTVKSLHFYNLFCQFKCHVNVPDDTCVNALLTKTKTRYTSPLFQSATLGVATEKPGVPLGRECLFPGSTLYLKLFKLWSITTVGLQVQSGRDVWHTSRYFKPTVAQVSGSRTETELWHRWAGQRAECRKRFDS